jgi:hypothetical protein
MSHDGRRGHRLILPLNSNLRWPFRSAAFPRARHRRVTTLWNSRYSSRRNSGNSSSGRCIGSIDDEAFDLPAQRTTKQTAPATSWPSSRFGSTLPSWPATASQHRSRWLARYSCLFIATFDGSLMICRLCDFVIHDLPPLLLEDDGMQRSKHNQWARVTYTCG